MTLLTRAMLLLAMLALAVFYVAPLSGAEETTDRKSGVEKKEKKDEKLPETVVKAKSKKEKKTTSGTLISTPVIEIAQNIEVVDKELIEERGATTYYETLSYVAGVFNGGKSTGSRTQGQANLRGFTGSNITLNGAVLPKTMPILFDAVAIGSVDFLKGTVGSTNAGQNTTSGAYGLGGSININTLQAVDIEQINVSLGSKFIGNESQRITIDYNKPISEQVKVRFTGAFESAEPFYLPSGVDGKESFFLSHSLVWDITDRLEIYFNATLQRTEEPAYQGIPYLRGDFVVDTDTYFGDSNSRQEYLAFTIQTGGVYEVTDSIDIQFGVSYIVCELDRKCWKINNLETGSDKPGNSTSSYKSANYEYYENICDNGIATFNYSERDKIDRNYYANAMYIHRFDISSTKHQFVFGADWFQEKSHSISASSNIEGMDIYNPSYDLSGVSISYKRSISEIRTYGLLVQDIMEWGKVRVLAGLRYDMHQSKAGEDGDALSPRIGATYMLTDTFALYGNYSHSEVPNFRYYDENGDTLTDPWTGTQYEVGIKKELWKNTLVSLCGYSIHQENTPQYDSDGDYYYLGGKTSSTGVEITIDGKITKNWRAFFSYAYINYIRVVDEYADYTTKPQHSIALWQTWTFNGTALEGFKVGLGARWEDDYYANFKGNAISDEYTVDSYIRIDLSLEYQFASALMKADDVKIRLYVENLFDEEYVESSRHASDSFPGAPRTVGLYLIFKY